jgi:xanthine dehydrogenase accessory factor
MVRLGVLRTVSIRFYAQVAEAERKGQPFVLATVVEAGGSTPRSAGARMMINKAGMVGTVGGGALEKTVIDQAHILLSDSKCSTHMISVHLVRDLAMCCGGKMSVFLEKVDPSPTLWIFGAGHVGTQLAHVAQIANFDVIVVDEREEWAGDGRFADGIQVMESDPIDHIKATPPAADDYVVIVTHAHDLDEAIIRQLEPHSLRYLGMIGSRGKWARFVDRFDARGIQTKAVERVHCPVGLDIGALTPAEIAISITAQLVEVRRGGAKWAK